MADSIEDCIRKMQSEGRVSSYGVNMDAIGDAQVRECAPGLAMPFSVSADLFCVSCRSMVNEKGFQNVIMNFGQLWGWRRAHFRKARVRRKGKETWETPIDGDAKGFLDCEFVRERLIKFECKFGKNTPTPEQLAWYAAYKRAGVECYIWYPENCEQIASVLRPV